MLQFLNPSSVAITSAPTKGSVSVSSGGVVTYTPAYNFVGTDTFAYTISDDNGATSNPAVDTVVVQGSLQISMLVVLPPQPAAPSPIGQDSNTLFVGGLYRDILGRPADQAGLSFWTSQIASGMSHVAVAQIFLHSGEHFTAEVANDYQVFFDRSADAGGLAHWVNALEAGATEQQVAFAFLTSGEFMSQHGSSDLFVNALYQDVLRRAADAAGLAGWQAALASGQVSNSRPRANLPELRRGG